MGMGTGVQGACSAVLSMALNDQGGWGGAGQRDQAGQLEARIESQGG